MVSQSPTAQDMLAVAISTNDRIVVTDAKGKVIHEQPLDGK
jgi:hypothetical protein